MSQIFAKEGSRTDEGRMFARLASVPEIGREGLERLRSATVAVVGIGGIGSAASEYLARSGLGSLKLVDQDIIEESNLARLHQADVEDLYYPKAEVVGRKLSQRYPWTRAEPIIDTLHESNINELLGNVDMIIDGLDNFRTRYVINKFSVRTQTPYIFASAIGNQGHLAVLDSPATACLQCIVRDDLDHQDENCETFGVTPAVVGVVGALEATEALKFLTDAGSELRGKLLTLDLAGPEFLITPIAKRANCPGCSKVQRRTPGVAKASLLCGEKVANVLPKERFDLDLLSIAQRVARSETLAASASVLVFRRGPMVVSLFKNGRVLISGVKDSDEAAVFAELVWNEIVY